jgi:hypothetical protein
VPFGVPSVHSIPGPPSEQWAQIVAASFLACLLRRVDELRAEERTQKASREARRNDDRYDERWIGGLPMFSPLVTQMSLVALGLCMFACAADAQEPPLARPKHPKVADRDWPRIPLDYFVLAKLEAKGTKPPTEADKETLLRRASLDLTGEAPTAEESAAIAADKSWNAYEKAVTRLLATPRSNEWMLRRWMDLVGSDDAEHRVWLRKAIAENLPLDRFVEEQANDVRWSAKVRERILAVSGIELTSGKTTPDATQRRLARTIADRSWRTLMKTDAATDPDILDWLACELMQSTQIDCCHLDDPLPQPWEMKVFLRTIVTCAAYRSR